MVIRVEVDDFPIGKSDPEAIFDKHVTFFFFGESGFASGLATLGMTVGLEERGFIVDELNSL